MFRNTPFGLSVWTFVLVERFDGRRPVRRVAAWLTDFGIAVAPCTLSSRIPRLHALFVPLSDAIRDRMSQTGQCQGDETGWRISQLGAEGRSRRAWLRVGLGTDCAFYHVDPSRSAAAAAKLFENAPPGTILVCDRCSACKKLVRDLGGLTTLQFCWAHARRDFVRVMAGGRTETAWKQQWVQRFAMLFRLHRRRRKQHDPERKRQSAAFTDVDRRLRQEVDRLFAEAERQDASLAEADPRRPALRSLLKHRQGLCVFLDHPATPLDNNRSETMLRGPAIGRKLSFGSDSAAGAAMTATMHSLVATLRMNGIDVRRWMLGWLEACAANDGQPPADLSPWLPWSMDDAARRRLQA